MAVAMGRNYTLIVTETGTVFSCGQNRYGQLGLGSEADEQSQQMLPVPIKLFNAHDGEDEDAVMVSAKSHHSACVTRQGSVWTWGCGASGQLGIAGTYRRHEPTPQRVYCTQMGRSPAVMVSCGAHHTLVLTAAGHVWSCGSNQQGQIGQQDLVGSPNPNFENISELTMIDPVRFGHADGSTRIAFIAAGYEHSMAISHDSGVLWTWGRNEGGQLGHPGNYPSDHNYSHVHVPKALPSETFGEPVEFAAADALYSMVVTASGMVWGCGYDHCGVLGTGQKQSIGAFRRVGGEDRFGTGGARTVACSRHHTLIVAHDASLWACGNTLSHGLGRNTGAVAGYLVHTRVDAAHFDHRQVAIAAVHEQGSIAVSVSGQVYTWGYSIPNIHVGLGYNCPHIQWTPRMIIEASFDMQRIGRWHCLPEADLLAFVMGVHCRLGAATTYLDLSSEMLAAIWEGHRCLCLHGCGLGLRNLLGVGTNVL